MLLCHVCFPRIAIIDVNAMIISSSLSWHVAGAQATHDFCPLGWSSLTCPCLLPTSIRLPSSTLHYCLPCLSWQSLLCLLYYAFAVFATGMAMADQTAFALLITTSTDVLPPVPRSLSLCCPALFGLIDLQMMSNNMNTVPLQFS